MAEITVRDTTLYYERTEGPDPQAPVLVFIHGMCGDAHVWHGQVERLSSQFTCVSYDRRGHTRSSRGTEPESVATHAADAAALIEALGLGRTIVVGSSGGARIAVELARTRPELLRGAVISEPPMFGLDPEAGQALMHAVIGSAGPAVEAGDARAAVDAFYPVLCPGLWSTLDEAAKEPYRANGPMMIEELTGTPYLATLDDMTSIDVPCLVVSGSISHPSLRTIAAKLAGALPDARFVELEGSGHVTYAERPAEFAEAVAAFAAEVGARTNAAGR
jgi:3-oxoadipate enol-lactonase